MSNVMGLPGPVGSRVASGAPGAGTVPQPANPFAAFIQEILGGFIGGSVMEEIPSSPAAPGGFAGLPVPAKDAPDEGTPAKESTGGEKSTAKEPDEVTPLVQLALISAFAPVAAPVVTVAQAEADATGGSADQQDVAPASNSGAHPGTPSAAAPGSLLPQGGDLIASLMEESPAPGQPLPLAAPGMDDGPKSGQPAGSGQGLADGTPDQAPPSAGSSQAAVGTFPGIGTGLTLALALDAVTEGMPNTSPAPANVFPAKPEVTQSPQNVTAQVQHTAPARFAEVPNPTLQEVARGEDVPATPRISRKGESGGVRDTKIGRVDAADPAPDDETQAVREISIAPDAASGENPAGGDLASRTPGPLQETERVTASPGPEPVAPQSTETAQAAPQVTTQNAKDSAGDASRVQQPPAGSAGASAPSPAVRNATQYITPAGDVVTRQESAPPAAPRQEIPAAYTTLPQELSRRIADQVVRNLSFQVDGTASEMRMTLRPPSLGEVQLHVHVEDSKMAAQIDVSQQLVKSALEAHMPQLRQALQEHGIEVQRIDVMVPEQSTQQGGAGSGGERTGRRSGRRGAAPGEDEQVQAVKDLGYNTIELIM
ncbi:MAG TPA: flagellar hook-length control protein FliK [Bacteroidota bacterium]|nr:flagellar hook-length control protein FliK [Bacteroidota bacterium]